MSTNQNQSLDIGELIVRLKSALADVSKQCESEFLDNNETLIRYLKSREWDVAAAEKMLRRTIAWRAEKQPQTIQCDYCRTNPGVHTLRQIGFDEARRPVLYASFYPANETQKNNNQEVLTHLIYTIENAVRSMLPGVSQWVFIIDCAGMTSTACHPRLGYMCAQIMANHYPERLGLAICIRPGAAFKVAWQAMKPFLSRITKRKVHIVSNKSSLLSTLEKYLSPSMTEWVLNEYKSNRANPVSARYRPFWLPCLDKDGNIIHDPKGEKNFVEEWIQVKHPSGFLPHPNIHDHVNGILLQSTSSKAVSNGTFDDVEEEEEASDLDEVMTSKILKSLPSEFQIPTDAEKLE